MICKKCLQDISGDCVLTGRPDVEGVCVFCHYDTNNWESNGQLVTKDQATRFKGWWTSKDLNLYDNIAEAISKFYPYSSSKVYKILKKSRSIDFCIKVLEYSMSYNVNIEQSLKDLEKTKEIEDFKCPNNSMICNQEYACDACPYNEDLKDE